MAQHTGPKLRTYSTGRENATVAQNATPGFLREVMYELLLPEP